MRNAALGAALAISCIALAASNVANGASVLTSDEELVPTGKGWGERPSPGPGPGQGMGQGLGQPQGNGKPSKPGGSSNGIDYHGGPVMTTTKNVYFIWYGNWSGNSATTILPDLIGNLRGSPYFNINTTYHDGSNRIVQNDVSFVGSSDDAYSHGTSLSDSAIQSVVASAITSGRLPKDTSGVYFVLTSSDVTASSGFCTQYCGWHTHGTIGGSDIKYSFVGNPDRCPSACSEQGTGPNGTGGADGMASIIAHELEEAATDPDLNAWYDRRGMENADKCAWTFGNTYTVSNGALANMKLGSRDYLIQQNWVNATGGYCSVKYP